MNGCGRKHFALRHQECDPWRDAAFVTVRKGRIPDVFDETSDVMEKTSACEWRNKFVRNRAWIIFILRQALLALCILALLCIHGYDILLRVGSLCFSLSFVDDRLIQTRYIQRYVQRNRQLISDYRVFVTKISNSFLSLSLSFKFFIVI